MFAIIISEKGGAERRESFDKTEINVGRVQGNDLMLPKGNVSKRHARLLYRDGRFIVTDLKSTNGTYVNGRKIAQATIVREGDKIYIGDFVLRIELSGEGQGAAPGPRDGASQPGVPLPSPPDPSSEDVAAQHDEGDGRQGGGFGARPSVGVPPPLPGAPTAGPPPMPMAPSSPAIPQAPPVPPAMAAPAPIAPAPIAAAPIAPPPMGGPIPPANVAPAPIAPAAVQPAPLPPAPMPPAPMPPAPMPQGGPMPPPMVPPAAPVQPAPGPHSASPSGPPPAHAAGFGAGAPPPPLAQPPLHNVARETALGPGPRSPALAPPIAPVPPAPIAPPAPAPPAPAPPAGAPPGGFGEAPAPPPVPPGFVPQPPPMVAGPPAEPVHPSAPPSAGATPPPAVAAAVSGASGPPAKVSAPPPASAISSVPASSQPAQSPRSSVRSAAASEGVVAPSQAQAHRDALARLMERATTAADLTALGSGEAPASSHVAAIERALNEKAAAMRASGELPAGIDPEVLVGEARRELLDLGPVGPLLEDEYVEEVQIIRHDHVVAMHGKKQVATEIAFTSEAAVARVVRRICVRSGRALAPDEVFVDRRLDRGARLFGVLPPASGDGHMLVIRKPQRALATLDELVKSGAVARQMATLLAQAVQGRANILVTGSVGAGATSVLGALAGAGNLEDRVVVLQEDDELVLNQPHTVSILIGDTAEEGARAVHAAIRVRPDRLVVGAFAGHVVPEIVDAIGDGVDGVLAAARAPTLRHLVARLPADIAATRRTLGLDTAREWLASAFDLVLEVARLRDGRNRVMRLSEFTLNEGNPLELRDIFTFTAERTAAGGTVEGSFHPTGVVPRIAEDLAARGAPLDLGMFKRPPR